MNLISATRDGLDPSALHASVRGALADAALTAAIHGGDPTLGARLLESDKRKQARVMRDLVAAGWLVERDGDEWSRYLVPPAAVAALAREPRGPLSAVREDAHGAFGPRPFARVDGQDPSDMLWRLQHPARYRWALCERLRDGGYWPIPLDNTRPIGPQVADIVANIPRDPDKHSRQLVLLISDDALVLAYQQHRARSLWAQHRGRTLLALARFGGYSKAEAKEEADEDDVDEIPSLGGGFIRARTPDRYDPARSWEDEAQKQLEEATEAIARAQARHAALLRRYTKVAVANPGPRPYDAMREKYETWIAEYIIRETGVDPRTLPAE